MSDNIRKPPWIRSHWPCNPKIASMKQCLRKNNLTTVCEEAACPNLGECFSHGTATFMIMGNICTRNCRFCNINPGIPQQLDLNEPINLANTIHSMALQHAVITSVTRDDLVDGGAIHFAACIKAIRSKNPTIKIEILTPDFKHCMDKALKILGTNLADIFNHNIETVPSLYNTARPQANYKSSLLLLKKYKELYPNIPTKSGIMLGLGETAGEIKEVLQDLRINNVDYLTLGQYLQPSKKHLTVQHYIPIEKFAHLAAYARTLGFKNVASAPLMRSSYYASHHHAEPIYPDS